MHDAREWGETLSTAYSSVVVHDNPLRYYRLGEASGSTAVDSSSSAQNGTYVGGVTLGQSGLIVSDPNGAVRFDGSTSYVSVPTTGLPTGSQAWSMECWFKYPVISSNYEGLLCMGHTVHNAHSVADLYHDPTVHKISIGFNSGDDLYPTSVVQAGVIYHIAATYDGTTVRLYWNGILQASEAVALNISYGICRVGGDDQSLYSSAIQDEAAFYGSALSDTQVAHHYAVGTRSAFVGNQGSRRNDPFRR